MDKIKFSHLIKSVKDGFIKACIKINEAMENIVSALKQRGLKKCFSNVTIAHEGKNTIYIIIFIIVVSFLATGLEFITTTLIFVMFLTLYFFRDPVRVLPDRKNVIVSPCDGLILSITKSLLPEELGGKDKNEYTKISVFMNINDVHIQRIPVDCIVKQVEYVKGAFVNASLDKESKDNERNIVLFERENGDNICIVQIAGFIARRIVCHLTKDEQCKIGEKYGMIKFGSRIEIYLPINYKIEVLKGQRLVCGETVVASF